MEAVKDCHAACRTAELGRRAHLTALYASSGFGKTHFLRQFARRLRGGSDDLAAVLQISFNGYTSLLQDATEVAAVAHVHASVSPAVLHLGLRLLWSGFQYDDANFGSFSRRMCAQLRAHVPPPSLDSTFLSNILRRWVDAHPDPPTKVTIMVDESGRLCKHLRLPPGDADEYSGLRLLSGHDLFQEQGFSVAVVQAGLGDFAEQTVSQRNVRVIALPDLADAVGVDCTLQDWVLCSDAARQAVKGLETRISRICTDAVRPHVPQAIVEVLLRPLVAEYLHLPRAVDCVALATEDLANLEVEDFWEDPALTIHSGDILAKVLFAAGFETRKRVNHYLTDYYGHPADRLLEPAVLLPAILPSHLRVQLRGKVGVHGDKVSELLSDAVYINSLSEIKENVKFAPRIVPAFLLAAAARQTEGRLRTPWSVNLEHLNEWWEALRSGAWWETVGLVNGGCCVIESWDSIMKKGVCAMLLTILQALRSWEGTFGPLQVAHIFLHTSEVKRVKGGLSASQYCLNAPGYVEFEVFPGLLDETQHDTISGAFDRAQLRSPSGATLFQLQNKNAEEGADFLCTLPLACGGVLLLGLLTHGRSWHPMQVEERAAYIEGCERAFWKTIEPFREELPGPRVFIYMTPEKVEASAVEEELRKSQLVSAEGSLLFMEQEGVRNLFGPLWHTFDQCVMRRPGGDTFGG